MKTADDKPENLDWNFDVFMPEADLAWTDSIEMPEFEPLPEFEELQMVEFEPLQLEWNIIEIWTISSG